MNQIVLILFVAVLGNNAHAEDSRSIRYTGEAQIQSNSSQQISGALRDNNTKMEIDASQSPGEKSPGIAPSASQFAVPRGGDAESKAGRNCRKKGGFYNAITHTCTTRLRGIR